MYELLKELCIGTDNYERGDVILERLRKIGADVEIQEFRESFFLKSIGNYRNIISRYRNGSSNRKIAISAHYDRTMIGQGALDNGAAVIECLGTLETLINESREADVTFLFFDGEERGMMGSDYYVKETEPDFNGLYNFDLTGTGDSLIICNTSYSVRERPCSAKLNEQASKVCEELELPYHLIRGPASDNLSFQSADKDATLIMSIADRLGKKWEGGKFKKNQLPYTIHCFGDKVEVVQPRTLDMMREYMLALIDSYN